MRLGGIFFSALATPNKKRHRGNVPCHGAIILLVQYRYVEIADFVPCATSVHASFGPWIGETSINTKHNVAFVGRVCWIKNYAFRILLGYQVWIRYVDAALSPRQAAFVLAFYSTGTGTVPVVQVQYLPARRYRYI